MSQMLLPDKWGKYVELQEDYIKMMMLLLVFILVLYV